MISYIYIIALVYFFTLNKILFKPNTISITYSPAMLESDTLNVNTNNVWLK